MVQGNKHLTKDLGQLIHDVKNRYDVQGRNNCNFMNSSTIASKIVGSYSLSQQMLNLLLGIITNSNWATADELMTSVRETGKILINALPQEATLANIVRRTLKIIREEYDELNMPQQAKQMDDSQAVSLQKLVTQNSEQTSSKSDYTNLHVDLRENLINHLNEIENELQLSHDNLAQQAPEHVHSSEIILTLGYSKSVEKFLKSVPKERKFEVVIAECAPSCRGHMLAHSLANAKIDSTVIPGKIIFNC